MTDIIVKRGTTVRYRWDVADPNTGAPVDVSVDHRLLGEVRPIVEGELLFAWNSNVSSGEAFGAVVMGNGYVQIELDEDQSRVIGGPISRAVYQVLLRRISSDEVTEVDSGKLIFQTAVVDW